MIVRAHECVMDGFERFAQGHLITLFSATNYCGTANNAGAILVLGRDFVMVSAVGADADRCAARSSRLRPRAVSIAQPTFMDPCLTTGLDAQLCS